MRTGCQSLTTLGPRQQKTRHTGTCGGRAVVVECQCRRRPSASAIASGCTQPRGFVPYAARIPHRAKIVKTSCAWRHCGYGAPAPGPAPTAWRQRPRRCGEPTTRARSHSARPGGCAAWALSVLTRPWFYTSTARETGAYPHISYYDLTNRDPNYPYQHAFRSHSVRKRTIPNVWNCRMYWSATVRSEGPVDDAQHPLRNLRVTSSLCPAISGVFGILGEF